MPDKNRFEQIISPSFCLNVNATLFVLFSSMAKVSGGVAGNWQHPRLLVRDKERDVQWMWQGLEKEGVGLW
jgi:hypothetical protein